MIQNIIIGALIVLAFLFCLGLVGLMFGMVLLMLEDLPADNPVRRLFHRFLSDSKKEGKQ